MITDIHTHHPDAADAIISVNPWEFIPRQGRYYSVGIHPWQLHKASDEDFKSLATAAVRNEVLMVGECGVDKLRGADVARQVEVTKFHAQLSEHVGKPLVLHCVRAANELCQLRRQLRPSQPWIVHGFRGNALIAQMLLNAGFHLSFGEHFNPDALAITPIDRLLVETDESTLSITEIYTKISHALQVPNQVLLQQIHTWTRQHLSGGECH